MNQGGFVVRWSTSWGRRRQVRFTDRQVALTFVRDVWKPWEPVRDLEGAALVKVVRLLGGVMERPSVERRSLPADRCSEGARGKVRYDVTWCVGGERKSVSFPELRLARIYRHEAAVLGRVCEIETVRVNCVAG